MFYRLISGLHASINVHLSAAWLHRGIINQPDHWGPNPLEFERRFGPEHTDGLGPQWLKNLYFLYLVELRALSKASNYLEKQAFFASSDSDQDLKRAVLELLNVTRSFKSHFDESVLFKGAANEARALREQFQSKFRNITRIMDCVGCDKCRLWGKVQTLALGTALKILFSGKTIIQLSRSEIVALFNGFARFVISKFKLVQAIKKTIMNK